MNQVERNLQNNEVIPYRPYYSNYNDRIRLSVDWISFTVQDIQEVVDVLDYFGFLDVDFEECKTGGHGYKKRLKHLTHNIQVYYEGISDDMGVHIDVSGSAVRYFFTIYVYSKMKSTPFGMGLEGFESVLARFCKDVRAVGHFTRMDIALDDIGEFYYSVDDVLQHLEHGLVVSRFRNYRNLEECSITGRKVGHTIYMGSSSSEIMLRIYDKKLEQNQGKTEEDENFVSDPWTRWELQLRKGRADECGKKLAEGVPLSKLFFGILSNYMRFVLYNENDDNRSRWETSQHWLNFIDNAESVKLTLQKCEKTLEVREQALEYQYGGRMAMLVLAHGGDFEFLEKMAMRNMHRISRSDEKQLKKERSHLFKQYRYDYDMDMGEIYEYPMCI